MHRFNNGEEPILNDKLLREAYESGRRQALSEQVGGGEGGGPPPPVPPTHYGVDWLEDSVSNWGQARPEGPAGTIDVVYLLTGLEKWGQEIPATG